MNSRDSFDFLTFRWGQRSGERLYEKSDLLQPGVYFKRVINTGSNPGIDFEEP